MIIEKRTLDNGATLAVWNITESVDRLLEILDNDPFVIEEISGFQSEKRTLEYLAVRCALNEITGKKTTISYLPSRMPYIKDHSMQISISHTGHYATVITHPMTPVGIDIERIGDKVVRVKNKFLNDNELNSLDTRSEKTHLTIMWAAKEALYKIIGVENVDFIKELEILPFQPYIEGSLMAKEYVTEAKAVYTLEYKVYPEYVIVWVSK